MATPNPLPQLIGIPELAALLGTSIRHIRRLTNEHRIPYLKVGRLIRFDPIEITRWLDEGRQPVSSPSASPGVSYTRHNVRRLPAAPATDRVTIGTTATVPSSDTQFPSGPLRFEFEERKD